MNNRLLKVAKYLGQNGLYKEAAQIKKLAEQLTPSNGSGVLGATGGRGWVYDNDWNISAIDLFNHAPKILAYIKSMLNQNQDSYDFVVDAGRLFIQKNNLSGYEEIPQNEVQKNPNEVHWIVQQGADMGFIEAKYYLNSIPTTTAQSGASRRDPLTGLPPMSGPDPLTPVPGRYGVGQDQEGNLHEYQDPPNYPTWKRVE